MQTSIQKVKLISSGQEIDIRNAVRSQGSMGVVYTIAGAPSTMLLQIFGLSGSAPPVLLDSYSGTTTTMRIVVLSATYDSFAIVGNWTGAGVTVDVALTLQGAGEIPIALPVTVRPDLAAYYATDGISLTDASIASLGLRLTESGAGPLTIEQSGSGSLNVESSGGLKIFDGSMVGIEIEETDSAGSIEVTTPASSIVLTAGGGVSITDNSASRGIGITEDGAGGILLTDSGGGGFGITGTGSGAVTAATSLNLTGGTGGLALKGGLGGLEIAESFTFTNLPAIPALGMLAIVTDSAVNLWGTTVTAAGIGTPYTVLAWFNGTVWTVIGV